MKARLFLLSLLVAFAAVPRISAQELTGGVKGTVINRTDRTAVENARLVLYQGATEVAEVRSSSDGSFYIPRLDNGMYTLSIYSEEFLETQVQVTVNDGYVKNMFNIGLTPARKVSEVVDESLAEFDMDDSGYNDNPTVLFGSNDVFSNIVGYNFSSVRFRQRGYLGESQDVLLAGVKMNDAITGYSPFSLWSGLNEAMRTKDATLGNDALDYGLGGYNGVTNIYGNASSVRKGLRGSVLTNSALYRLRLMASYATGVMDNGWSFAANVSARLGGNDWIDGVYYRSFAYYLAADKQIDDANRIGFVFFATPGQRGAQNASTQEVYDLIGDNMYNSNWGYQNGVVRNARVRKTNEPVAILRYDYTPTDNFQAGATLLYRFGKNGYTALDWYDSADPRPDYYRNLPSYFNMDNDDLNRSNYTKAGWAREAWTHPSLYPDIVHVNWDRLYTVNSMNYDTYGSTSGNRSKYVQEERHVDQRDLNFAANFKWRPNAETIITGGANAKINRTENYKIIADLLGGDYYVNIDNFADRDYGSTPAKVQNDLDYYMANGSAQVLKVGDKYGYDYLAQIRKGEVWANGVFSRGNLSTTVGARLGVESFWREGLMRKGLFPGVDDNGNAFVVDGVALDVAKDHNGEVITSYGKSKVATFVTGAFKLGLNYVLGGNQRVYANAGWFRDAPKFNQVFLSPRTRNSMMDELKPVRTAAYDINWQFTGGGYNARVTAYYTTIKDQSKVMSAYDDLQNAFSNFALTGIDERHAGVEVGVKVPTPVPSLFVQGALSAGRYVYTSNPYMTQTVDNSADLVIDNTIVPYWKETPVYVKDASGNYQTNASGEFTKKVSGFQEHYVPSTPQLAASIGLSYNWNYWFIDADVQYFAESYLDMNPLYRTDYAVAGPDGIVSPVEVEYMTSQEKFDPACLLNLSVGKSWYIQRKYQLGFSLNARNLLNNTSVKTGGYEQTRIVDNTVNKERYYRFDPKYFYMSGFNYMLNIYFRF